MADIVELYDGVALSGSVLFTPGGAVASTKDANGREMCGSRLARQWESGSGGSVLGQFESTVRGQDSDNESQYQRKQYMHKTGAGRFA